MKKKVFIAGIILLLLAGGFLLKSVFTKGKEAGFQFTPIIRGDLENIVSSTGTLSAVETVEVGSQVSGIIDKIFVDFNDAVEKGQVMAVLDKTLFNVVVREAEAGVLRTKAILAQAEAELKRNQPLYEKGHLSEMEFLVTKTSAETAKADVKTAEAALNKAKTNLGYTVIRSPIKGTVIERTVDAGQTIAASFQAPQLFIIAKDLTRMQIETNVDESDIGMIKENQSVQFTVQAYPDEIFTGNVRQIRLQPTTIQNVVNYTVVVDASNEKGLLLPGMTATVDFLVEERKDVLLVSNTALSFTPSTELLEKYPPQMMKKMAVARGGSEGRVFYLDSNGIPTPVIFVKGTTDGKMTEIMDSKELKEGMAVITAYGADKAGKNSKSKRSAFMPPPPGGGGPR